MPERRRPERAHGRVRRPARGRRDRPGARDAAHDRERGVGRGAAAHDRGRRGRGAARPARRDHRARGSATSRRAWRARARRCKHRGLLWPNAESAVNSDPWLVANHDRIRSMRPRVLVVNFVHGLGEAAARDRVERLRAVLRESSRWQGYRDPAAPPFLDYDVVGIVDLTEPRGRVDRNSAQFPRTPDGVGFDYAALHEMRLQDGLSAGSADRARAGQRGLAAGRPHRAQRAVGDGRGQARLRRGFPPAAALRACTRATPASTTRRGSAAACGSCSSTSTAAWAARWRASGTRSSGWRLRRDPVLRALLPRALSRRR